MHILSLIIDILLAVYIGYEVVRFLPRYREFKQALAHGDARARIRIYYEALVFESVSAMLAMLALGLDRTKLDPRALALESTPWIHSLSHEFSGDAILGMAMGSIIGLLGMIVIRLGKKRRPAAPALNVPAPWWKKLMPDFSSLIPVTTRERVLWAAVAISAGVCEEIVFRGWLLATLHGPIHLNGVALLLVAAGAFGLAHLYQKITGVLLTAFIGIIFCVLYVKTGSLLVPILLHIVIDLRFAFLPAQRVEARQAAYA